MAHIAAHGLTVRVEGEEIRNEEGRLRINELNAVIEPELDEADAARITLCTRLFEDFCTVTQSVRNAIPVNVEIAPKILESATTE